MGKILIAYNHSIRFASLDENRLQVESGCRNEVVFKACDPHELPEHLDYELSFLNNQGRDTFLRTDRPFATKQKEQPWAFEVRSVVTFFWYSGKSVIYYIPHESYSTELLKYWALHILLPMHFTVEERYHYTHAGAVELAGKGILFIADSFGGKSTMTNFFMKQGHTMVSDDKVAIVEEKGELFAVPSHPYHRPYRKMEDLGDRVANFSASPLPVHAVYALEKGGKSAQVSIKEVKGVEKFLSLRTSSEMNLFFQKPLRFEHLTNMAKSLPLFKVAVPWDMERLADVYDAIVQHSSALKKGGA